MEKTSRLNSILNYRPVFLLTIPLIFFLHTLTYYYGLLHWKYIVLPVALTLIAPLIMYWLLSKLWRSPYRAGIFMAACLVIFYFFSAVFDLFRNSEKFSFLGRYAIMLPLVAIILIMLGIYLHRQKGPLPNTYRFINLVSIFLCAGGLIQFIVLSFGDSMKRYDQADPGKKLSSAYQPCDTCSKPDIYFFLFDGYTNTKTLQQEFNYDNSGIEAFLRDKGFFIATHSRSNYNFTHMSMASEFNLDYLYNLDNTKRFFYTKDFFESYYTIFHSEWFRILSKQGYSINNLSQFAFDGVPVKTTPHLTELTWRSVLGQTFFNKLNRDIGWKLDRFRKPGVVPSSITQKINDDVKRLDEVYKGVLDAVDHPFAKPQFMYAHFLVPHETFYYDSTGKRYGLWRTASTQINKEDYVQQSVYANKFLMKPLIDSIFQHARRPFVIIIQSDHGYRQYPKEKVDLEFENFGAFYFSDQDYRVLSDTMSSVNTFRRIANKYFNQRMPLLRDSVINLYKRNSY